MEVDNTERATFGCQAVAIQTKHRHCSTVADKDGLGYVAPLRLPVGVRGRQLRSSPSTSLVMSNTDDLGHALCD